VIRLIANIGLDIGGLARWLYAEPRSAGWSAIYIDPPRLRGLTKTMPVRTDRNDARAITQAMPVGWRLCRGDSMATRIA
jgi:transposase